MGEKLFILSDQYLENEISLDCIEEGSVFVDEVIKNRVSGIVYDNLTKMNQSLMSADDLEKLRAAYLKDINKAKRFKKNMLYLCQVLKDCKFNYALLKGAFLTTQLYKEGHRTSNDIDILIEEQDIDKCQQTFFENGFIQGTYSEEDGLVPATRREIIMSRMNYGETIPLVKLIDGHPLFVDINFSLDFKPPTEKNTIKSMLDRAVDIQLDGGSFKSLEPIDFFIHLCCHLYKEATTYAWVEYNSDLSLYKFSDINLFLHRFNDKTFMNALIDRTNGFGVNKECYYTLVNSAIIYPGLKNISGYDDLVSQIKPQDLQFMKQIIMPMENRVMAYKLSFSEWFMCKDKVKYLEEII